MFANNGRGLQVGEAIPRRAVYIPEQKDMKLCLTKTLNLIINSADLYQ